MKKIIVSILIIFLCTVSIGHSKLYLMEESFYNRYGVSAEGLVLWLDQFDGRSYGNAGIWYDISGNGNHAVQGTGANQPAITGALGLAGSCRSFDGDNDNLVTGFNPFNEINTSDFTISVWLRHTGGVDRRYIIGPTTPAPRFYCRLNVPGELNRIVWGLGNDFKTFSTVLQANQFYCVTFVFDYSAGGLSLFLDGVFDELIISAAFKLDLRNGLMTIGDNSNSFQGLISNLTLFSRALSAAEVKRLYLADAGRHGGL